MPEIFHLGLNRLDHLTRIAPANHEHGPYHDLPLPVEDHRTMANGVADTDFRNIPNEDRRTA